MDDNKKNDYYCGVCGSGPNGKCGVCGMGRGYFGHSILRWILGIIIISWIFCIGMKIGEWKTEVEFGSSSYHVYRYGAMPMMYGAQGGQSGNVFFSSAEAVPATTVTSSSAGVMVKKPL
jgi:hypothetical protein